MSFESFIPKFNKSPKKIDTISDSDVLIEEKNVEEPFVEKEEKSRQEIIKIPNELEIRNFSKKYHHPGYRTGFAEEIIEAKKSGKNVEDIKKEFYEKTLIEKKLFESQGKERSISEIMKEKDIVFVHGIPLSRENWMEGGGDHFNNEVVDNRTLTFEDSYNIVAGLEGTVSASIPSPHRGNNGLYYRTGTILGEGKILFAKNQDSGSVAFNINKRIPKYRNEDHKHSAIQPEINLDKVIDEVGQSKWNELIIEKPKIAGLYIDLSFKEEDYDPTVPNPRWSWKRHGDIEQQKKAAEEEMKKDLSIQEKDLIKMREISKEINVPLYAFKNENGKLEKYRVDTISGTVYEKDPIEEFRQKAKEILLKNNRSLFSKEYKEFIDKAEKILEIWKIGEYTLVPVSNIDILEAKRKISLEERRKMVEEVKEKGILKNVSEKEIEQALKE